MQMQASAMEQCSAYVSTAMEQWSTYVQWSNASPTNGLSWNEFNELDFDTKFVWVDENGNGVG